MELVFVSPFFNCVESVFSGDGTSSSPAGIFFSRPRIFRRSPVERLTLPAGQWSEPRLLLSFVLLFASYFCMGYSVASFLYGL